MSETNGLATRDDVQRAGKSAKRRFKTLEPLPLSGLKFRIQSLTETELSRYQSAAISTRGTGLKKSKLEDSNTRLFVRVCVDQAGNRLLNDSDTHFFNDFDSVDTAFLFEECAVHCGINRNDIAVLEKNSETTTVENSPSD